MLGTKIRRKINEFSSTTNELIFLSSLRSISSKKKNSYTSVSSSSLLPLLTFSYFGPSLLSCIRCSINHHPGRVTQPSAARRHSPARAGISNMPRVIVINLHRSCDTCHLLHQHQQEMTFTSPPQRRPAISLPATAPLLCNKKVMVCLAQDAPPSLGVVFEYCAAVYPIFMYSLRRYKTYLNTFISLFVASAWVVRTGTTRRGGTKFI